MLMPMQVGALVKSLALDEAEVGLIATVELLSLAITLFALAPKIAFFNKRKLATRGALLLVAGHGKKIWRICLKTGKLLLPCRAAVGLGAGMAIAAGNAVVANELNSQKLFAIVFTIGQFQAACLLLVFPFMGADTSHAVVYGCLALWTIVMLVLVVKLPAQANAVSPQDAPEDKADFRVFLLPSVLAMIFIGASDASLWTFQERIADNLGLDAETIGLILSGAVISGMLGAALAAVLGNRLGRMFPIIAGLLWMAICYIIITHTELPALYIASELSYLFAYGFVIPYLFGLNGDLDSKGGAMVAANGCNLIGISLGPVGAGYIIVQSGYSMVGITISAFALLAMAMYMVALRKAKTGRSKGISLAVGFQSVDDLYALYGKENANVIISQFLNKAFLRLSDETTSKWAETLIGQMELLRITKQKRYTDFWNHLTGWDIYANHSDSETYTIKPAVMASEFREILPINAATNQGLTGWYVGHYVYKYYEPFKKLVAQLPQRASHVKDRADAPDHWQRFEPWTMADLQRLNLIQYQELLPQANTDKNSLPLMETEELSEKESLKWETEAEHIFERFDEFLDEEDWDSEAA